MVAAAKGQVAVAEVPGEWVPAAEGTGQVGGAVVEVVEAMGREAALVAEEAGKDLLAEASVAAETDLAVVETHIETQGH